jgi:hypothetical protein
LSSPPLHDPAPPQSTTFCTDSTAAGHAPERMMLARSASAEVEANAQQEPQ